MRTRTTYKPSPSATPEQVCQAAYNCGRDLRPNDRRASWIDELTGSQYTEAVEAYHAGQAEQYECEDW